VAAPAGGGRAGASSGCGQFSKHVTVLLLVCTLQRLSCWSWHMLFTPGATPCTFVLHTCTGVTSLTYPNTHATPCPPPPPPHTHPFSTLQQCVAAGGGPGAGLHQQQPRQRATRPVQHLVPGAVLVLVRGPESAGGQERGTTLATTSRRQAMSSGGGPGDAAGDGVCSWLTPCMPCLALPPPPPTTPTPRGCVCAGCLLTLGWSCSWRWTPTSGSPPATAAGR
jgi:hypothetical protein